MFLHEEGDEREQGKTVFKITFFYLIKPLHGNK